MAGKKTGKKILIIDDEKPIGKLVGHLVRSMSHQPIICENGEQAIEHIEGVDLIITDFNLSGGRGLNGVQLAKKAKTLRPELPVIIMTGNSDAIPPHHLADGVIDKPFGLDWLRYVISDCLRNRFKKGGEDGGKICSKGSKVCFDNRGNRDCLF
ncbi:response regulator [Candidatus Azambacteria bacterium]|nr:response regulator [Candidatus Azambacteria bacterium]